MVGAGTDQFNLVISRLKMLKVADSDLDSLPDDMLMQILLRIPAQDIHDSTMFVCWKWYNMIRSRSFIYTHLHHSTPGLLMANLMNMTLSTFLSLTQGSVQCKISDFSYFYRRTYCRTSCNGLMLKLNNDDNDALTVTNPLTKQGLALPPFTPVRIKKCQYPTSSSVIAYDATRMEYKVVRTYYLWVDTHDSSPMAPKQDAHYFCVILTVGVDNSWRRVDTQHLSLTTSKQLRSSDKVVTQGFVHWTKEYSSYVLSLNIQTEIMTRIPVPTLCEGRGYYLMGESYLSLLIGVGRLKFEVWEMKPETGEWTKLPDINLENHKCLLNETYHKVNNIPFKPGDDYCILRPAGWLKYREIIVFVALRMLNNMGGYYSPDQLNVVYNIQTRDIYVFKSAASSYIPFVVHKYSLVRIPG